MSRSANPTAVGAFVLGAVALTIAAFAYFGSINLGSQNRRSFVTFFRESAEGLQIGSDVTFKGVPVGRVKRILIRFEDVEMDKTTITNMPTGTSLIPVIYEIDTDRVTRDLGVSLHIDDQAFHYAQIKSGLQAKLKTSSFITGLLHLDLDYYSPDENGISPNNLEATIEGRTYNVIPPKASDLAALKEEVYTAIKRFSKIDFESLTESITAFAKAGESKIDEIDIKKLNETIASLNTLVSSPKITDAFTDIGNAASKVGEAADKLEQQVDSWEIDKLVADARKAIKEIEVAANKATGMLGEDSKTRRELDRTLEKVADAASEVEELAAYVKEHPNSLIFGRKDKDSDTDERREAFRQPGSKLPGRR
ncbi:MlaD family protein [Verrucomicrobiales bacterium]|nr:MlaD family protein [Verrucomicrobiales bacterium]